jgi:hypothetical protein
LEQALPAAHAAAQLPQLAPSDSVSTQPFEHWVRPDWHAQVPLAHVLPSAHALPQLPQLASSAPRSAQPLGHWT